MGMTSRRAYFFARTELAFTGLLRIGFDFGFGFLDLTPVGPAFATAVLAGGVAAIGSGRG